MLLSSFMCNPKMSAPWCNVNNSVTSLNNHKSQSIHLAELVQPTLCLINRLDPFLGLAVTPLQRVGEWRKPRVKLDNTYRLKGSIVVTKAIQEREGYRFRPLGCHRQLPRRHWRGSWTSSLQRDPYYRASGSMWFWCEFKTCVGKWSPNMVSRVDLDWNVFGCSGAQLENSQTKQ